MRTIFLVTALVGSLAGCAASIPKEELDKFAFIRAGSTNIWSLTSGGSSVSLKAIDGVATEKSSGPLAVSPGKHRITMVCAGNENELEITFNVGEIYEYAYGAGGPNGCFGGLVKVK